MISTIAARSIRAGIRMGRGGDIDGVGFTWPKLVGAAYVRTRVRFARDERMARSCRQGDDMCANPWPCLVHDR
jgi:hypothetical protein